MASGKYRTGVHPLVMRQASSTQIIGKLCGRRAEFSGFSTTAAKLVAREREEELKWSSQIEGQGEGRGGEAVAALVCVAAALPLLS